MGRFVCIHGHFYQPPRENPWLEAVEVQDSAAPYHDWNQRVTAECYAPNAAARMLCPAGTIENIVNNYERISFNFGPTLLWWLAAQAPEVVAALQQADQASLARWGHGNALAQVYNHLIMPLATRGDKLTQIRWGIKDFEHYFGRRPEGMWLAETAVDAESLELMAGEGIKFTILAPHQASAVRPPGGGDWQTPGPDGVDFRRPYRVATPAGDMAVFFYQGPLSRAVAFERLLDDGARFAQAVKDALPPEEGGDVLLTLATDGESYGHHHRFGEMALAFALNQLEGDSTVQLTNLAAFLAGHPPAWEARIAENTSWSCPHGVERWRSDCGCAPNPGSGQSQAWRGPLRRAVDQLLERLALLLESEGGKLFNDPRAARDAYVELVLDQSPARREEFFAAHQSHPLDGEERVRALKLMESQRWGLFAATSCAWFFGDLAGIEAVQNLRFAARALQLAGELDGGGWEEEITGILAEASSNQPGEGSGADIWRRRVAPARVGPRRVAAHAAISGVMGTEPPPEELFIYELVTSGHHHRSNLGLDLSWGRLSVTHRRLGQPHHLVYAALHPGGHEFLALVAADPGSWDPESLDGPVEPLLRTMDRRGLKELLQESLGGQSFTLADLFLEGRRSLAQDMLERTLASEFELARNLYETHRDTMRFLREINVPRPKLFEALASAVLAGELIRLLYGDHRSLSAERLGELVGQARELELDLEGPRVRRAVEEALTREVATLAAEPGDAGALERAGSILDLSDALNLEPNLWQAQNIFFELARELGPERLGPGLAALGRRLKLDMTKP
jgi:alpha-amylase/alpha-mannosidase (GH57 family)